MMEPLFSKITDEDKALLLQLARQAILSEIDPKAAPLNLKQQEVSEALKAVCGVFVTLRSRQGALRGCIGSIYGSEPLYQEVPKMACKAAFEDPRFEPLTLQHFSKIGTKISLLSPPKTVASMDQVEIGRHGLIFKRPPFSGLFLPEVPVEQNWNKSEYLQQIAYKAGVAGGDPSGGELFTFETLSFGN